MTDVLIKDMEMPSVCDECWALDESGDYPMCRITRETRGYNFHTCEKIMDKCPLVEVPHGHWVGIDDYPFETWECDRCGHIENGDDVQERCHYCPNCGAKMEIEQDD